MRDLVIGERERIGRTGIQLLAADLVAHAQPAGLAQCAIDVHRIGNLRDAVFRQGDDVRAGTLRHFDQFAADVIHELHVPGNVRMVGTEALQVVIEVRQVDECQRRAVFLEHLLRAAPDPFRRRDVGCRAPELEKRKLANGGLQLVAQFRRIGIDIGKLAPVGGIHRPRRGRDVGRGIHVVPPEHLGAGERRVAALCRFPDFFAFHQPV